MSTWYYTDSSKTQQGPVDDSTLLSLNREGAINAKSLVWKEPMAEWSQFGEVAGELFGNREDGTPVEIGVCAHSHQVYPVEELMTYGDALVAKEHKDQFVQQLHEGGQIAIQDAGASSMTYAGFWWRTLAIFLDNLIMMIPNGIFMIPYYVVIVGSSLQAAEDEAAGAAVVAIIVTYAIGIIGTLGLSIFYETWMVGKYQGTLGKLIVGVKVVRPDGKRLSYKRAFLRWLAKIGLNYLIIYAVSFVGLVVVFGALGVLSEGVGNDDSAGVGIAFMAGMLVYCILLAVSAGVFWMAAFDEEKRALHDRIVSTRVVKK